MVLILNLLPDAYCRLWIGFGFGLNNSFPFVLHQVISFGFSSFRLTPLYPLTSPHSSSSTSQKFRIPSCNNAYRYFHRKGSGFLQPRWDSLLRYRHIHN